MKDWPIHERHLHLNELSDYTNRASALFLIQKSESDFKNEKGGKCERHLNYSVDHLQNHIRV